MIFEEKVLLLSMALLGFLFSRLPYAGVFVRTLNTLFHELGHAFAAYITSGKVHRIDLFSDTSGSTITESGNKREQILIALSGYFFTSIVFVLFLLLIRWQWEQVLNLLIVASFVLSLLFYVKNTFGIIWLISMLGTYFSLYYWVPQYSWMVVYVFAGVLWWESVYSSAIIFILSIRDSNNAGDAGNLSRLTHIPSPFLGIDIFSSINSILFHRLPMDSIMNWQNILTIIAIAAAIFYFIPKKWSKKKIHHRATPAHPPRATLVP